MAAEVVVKFIGDAKSFDRAASGVSGTLGKLGTAAAAAGVAIGAAAVGGSVMAIKAFGDFDQAMTESLAIMGDVSDEMKKEMSDAAREVGKTTTFSATQAAESYYFLASAGLDATQAVAAMPAVAQFAQAGMFDMALATDLLTDAQSALGLTVDDATENLTNMNRVADTLVGANTLANASVEQFSSALTNKAGPAMRAVGMDIEEGVAVLAAFADQGVKGEEAGTQFSIVMRDLQTKALANKDAFAAAGVAVFDANGEFNNMADIVGDLEVALAGMSDAAKKETLLKLGFSDKSVASLTTLLGTSDKIREYEESLRGMSGITGEVADKQLESFNAQMGLLKARFEDVLIVVGSKLAPILLQFFDDLDAAWAKHGNKVIMGFRYMQRIFTSVVSTIRDFWKANGDAIMRKATEISTKVVAVVRQYWPQIRDTIQSVMESVRSIIESIVIIATALWDRFGEGIMRVVKIAFEFVLSVIQGVWKIIDGIFKFFAGVLTGDWQMMWDGIKSILDGAWQIITAVIEAALKIIWEILKAAWGIIKDIFKELWHQAKRGLDAGWDAVTGAISAAVTWIGDKAQDFWDAGKSLGSKIIDGIKSGISGAADIAANFANVVKNKIKDVVNSGVIDKVNRGLEFEISAFGQKVTINPPDIPRLAKGGYATSPTLAIVGDTVGEGEIIAPESKMRQIMQEVMNGNGGGISIGTINMQTNATPAAIVRELAFAKRSRRI